ncbi:MAG: hypothetical protein QOG62_2282 [Thermoleophilaceae bacterium]|jgi:NTE family protein|nr:hypothetical protein [Thermoleophilaceae bacterium]
MDVVRKRFGGDRMGVDRTSDKPGVAIVLPGGGARGAYEVGALSVLLPKLEERGESAEIICGVSVGAINAAALASWAHLPAREQAGRLLDIWHGLDRADIFTSLLSPRTPLRLAMGLAETLGVPGLRGRSLLDARPLHDNLPRWIDFDAISANIDSEVLQSVCAVATSLDGTAVGFVQGADPAALRSASEDIRYVGTTLEAEHVRASAAIPMLFPPVRIRSPKSAEGYYIDGAARLNTPIKPALDLGASRVIVVGFEPLVAPRMRTKAPLRPQLSDIVANVLDGLLLDQVKYDMHRLAAINTFFADTSAMGSVGPARAYRESRGRRPYRRVSYAFVTPRRRRELGTLAEQVFARRYSGRSALKGIDFALMGRVLGGANASRGELLSFLLFDHDYISGLIDLGRRDAKRWLARHPGFWCADSAHDFDLDPLRAESEAEVARLDEWRTLQRR